MIQSIEYKGALVQDCSVPGQGRDKLIHPAHPNGIRLSRDRWLLLYGTRGFRGTDDERSAIYQIRKDGFDGPVLREGILASWTDDWRPLDDGKPYVKQHGHPVAFGVPKGALVGGRRVAHENVFAVLWRYCARIYNAEKGYLLSHNKDQDLLAKTTGAEWMQCRFNDAGDDIEILQPTQPLRQKGYEGGPQFCSHPAADAQFMIKCFSPASPFNRDCSEWADVNHFNWGYADWGKGRRVAVMRYRFNAARRLYEWVETGPLLGDGVDGGVGEASLVPYRDDWLVAARSWKPGGVLWMRTDDPFGRPAPVVRPADVYHNGPIAAYRCADGVVRLATGDMKISPHANGRNPLYLWDIDPDRDFAASNRRVVLDTLADGLPFPIIYQPAASPIIDMAKLLPHGGGKTQLIAFRVRTNGHLAQDPDYYVRLHYPTKDEIAATAVHYAAIHYAEEQPAAWEFAS